MDSSLRAPPASRSVREKLLVPLRHAAIIPRHKTHTQILPGGLRRERVYYIRYLLCTPPLQFPDFYDIGARQDELRFEYRLTALCVPRIEVVGLQPTSFCQALGPAILSLQNIISASISFHVRDTFIFIMFPTKNVLKRIIGFDDRAWR